MRSISVKRIMLAAGAAVFLAGGSIGYAVAQQGPNRGPSTQQPGRPANDAFLEALAGKLGVSVERLRQAITEARVEVGAGERRPGRPAPLGRLRALVGLNLPVAAQAIGITVEQLRQELPGKSLADVARAYGKNPTDLATALRNAANQRLDQAVTNGRLTAERANEIRARLEQRVDQPMNRVVPQGLGERRRGTDGSGPPRPGTSGAPGATQSS